MEGDRRLVLLEPVPPTQDEYSEVDGPPIEHVAWALRMDRGGREGVIADTMVGEWHTRFRVRRDGIESLDHRWEVRDEDGRIWDIEAVNEVPMPPRRWLHLYCVRRT